ncbi:MAG: hypothetical protein Q9169_004291 [Polycauliona sp. 2 TL-2023]
MAALAFPNITTSTKLSSGVNYSYVHIQPGDRKPYLLLLHGFPSSAYDWRFQIKYFSDLGYGLIVPDLLGYGATDKPQDKEAYRLKKMCGEVVEILDVCGAEKVVGIGHDWYKILLLAPNDYEQKGSFLLGRLANYHPTRFSKLAFLDIGYGPPNPQSFSVDPINALTTQMIGYPIFGYWHFFKDEDSGDLMTDNIDHTISVCFPLSNSFIKQHFCFLGALRAYYTSSILSPPAPTASWITDTEIQMHKQIFSKENGGYGPPLNWYKCEIANLNVADEAGVAEADYYLKVPTLLVTCKDDPIGVPEVQRMNMKPWVEEKLLKEVEVECGHWCMLEKGGEVNGLLEGFSG